MEEEGVAGGAIGMWLNKRAVSRFEIPVEHQLTAQTAGWRLDVAEAGTLVFVVDHERVRVDLRPGDYVLASGDDLYVSFRERRDDRRPEPDETSEERDREEKRDPRRSRKEGK